MKKLFLLLLIISSKQLVIAQCQEILPIIDNVSVPSTTVTDATTGIVSTYYDICQGEAITFTAHAEYPDNNTSYSQSDATSTFSWSSNGNIPQTGTSTTFNFPNGGGYEIILNVTDSQGCSNTNQVKLFVRVSMTPIINVLAEPQSVCPNQDTQITALANTSVSSAIVTTSPWESEPCEDEFSDPLYLPDGNGASYQTEIQIACFQDGQTLNNVSDLLSIDINIEHSYTGDLDIYLTAPNGVQITLFNQAGGGTWFGEASDGNSSPNNPGIGYDYGWSMTPSYNGTMAQGFNNNNTTTAPGSWNNILNEDSYLPVDNFSNLLGTELNGAWTLTVVDNLTIDNGWVFSWGVTINPALIPAEWSFTNTIAQTGWVPALTTVSTNGNEMIINPPTAGTYTYDFEVIDDFGCSYHEPVTIEALSNITALSTTTPDTCTQGSGTATIEGAGGTNPYTYSWPTLGATTQTVSNLTPGNYTYTVTDDMGCIFEGEATVNQEEVLINLALVETTPDACEQGVGTMLVEPINGVAPYSYNWDNSASTSALGTDLLAGNQSVTVTDGNGCLGEFTEFIDNTEAPEATAESTPDLCVTGIGEASAEGFGGIPPYSYSWPSTGATTATATGLTPGNYQYIVTDSMGCTFQGEVTVGQINNDINLSIAQTTPDACSTGVGTMLVQPLNGVAPYTYNWANSNSSTSLGTNLLTGNQSVTVIDGDGCEGEFTGFVGNIPPPESLTSTNPDLCVGGLGEANVTGIGGTPPYTYLWPSIGATSPTVYDLTSGDYPYIITDAMGCTFQGEVTVLQIDANVGLELVQTTSDACEIGIGTMSVQPITGIPPYSYNWDNSNSNTSTGTSLLAGNQSVTVTDGNGCIGEFTGFIDNIPPPIAAFDYDLDDCSGNLQLQNESSTDAINFQWDVNSEIYSFDISPTFYLNQGLFYEVTLVASHEYCADTTTSLVDLTQVSSYTRISFPNIFTPNGDLENDVYQIIDLLDCDNGNFRIYDRWGNEMFYTVYPRDEFWDGTKLGKEVNEGVYFYVLELEYATLKGTFTLLR